MKKLTLMIHEDLEQTLADFLREHNHIQGFTFVHVEGHNLYQSADDASNSIHDQVIGYSPQVRAEILLEAQDIPELLDAMRKASIGLAGHTSYWVSPIEEYGRI